LPSTSNQELLASDMISGAKSI